mmetsp:Transcript_13369/g.34470  ORF Transcript_13369/g.34470 Transcript_13369/m.34470 type:complete len:218 (+) Transcript_13369:451-1104(+)
MRWIKHLLTPARARCMGSAALDCHAPQTNAGLRADWHRLGHLRRHQCGQNHRMRTVMVLLLGDVQRRLPSAVRQLQVRPRDDELADQLSIVLAHRVVEWALLPQPPALGVHIAKAMLAQERLHHGARTLPVALITVLDLRLANALSAVAAAGGRAAPPAALGHDAARAGCRPRREPVLREQLLVRGAEAAAGQHHLTVGLHHERHWIHDEIRNLTMP